MKTSILKTTIQRVILFAVVLIQVLSASAQQNKTSSGQPVKKGGEKHEKIEAQKIAFITQQVELTPDEAKVFWPLYNEYEDKRHNLRKSFYNKEDHQKTDFDKMTEKEASQILDKQLIEAQKAIDLRNEYVSKFRNILPAVKVLKLQDAEREFQKMLIDKLREHKEQAPPRPK